MTWRDYWCKTAVHRGSAHERGSKLACPTPKTRRSEAQAANFINNIDLMQWARSTFISSNRFLELFRVLHLERCCSNLTTGTRQPAPRRPGYRLLVLPPSKFLVWAKSKGSGVSLNISIRMNQNKSPRKTSALQIASVYAVHRKKLHLAR
jgi:hypothetical protein